jgi:hypothetical protein
VAGLLLSGPVTGALLIMAITAIDTTIWAADAVALGEHLPMTLTVDATSEDVVVPAADDPTEHTLDLDGYSENRPMIIEAGSALFTLGVPDVGDTVTINSIKRQVVRRTDSPDDTLVSLELEKIER